MSANTLGKRIKTRRTELGYRQAEMCRLMGFEGSRTLSAIETGKRDVSAEELVRLTEVLEAPLEYFTDPFRLVGEGSFTWRHNGLAQEIIENCEQQVGGFVALFRELGAESGRLPPVLQYPHGLSKSSNIIDAAFVGEKIAHDCELAVESTRDEQFAGQSMQMHGDIHAQESIESDSAFLDYESYLHDFESYEDSELRLKNFMERDLGILVLMIDAVPGILSAACRLDDLNSVIINRNQPSGRRHYELAYELFHILTWDALPPERIKSANGPNQKHVDQLANSFVTALLKTMNSVGRYNEPRTMFSSLIVRHSDTGIGEHRVAPYMLAHREVNKKYIPDYSYKTNFSHGVSALSLHEREEPNDPPLFSQPFLELLAESIDMGRISTRRVASLLELSVDELPKVFHKHDVEFELGI